MNANHGPGGRSARERLREQQAREKAAGKRARTLKMAGAVVAVLVVAAAVGVLIARGGGEDAGSDPVTVGRKSAPATLTVYEDFRCPACAQFEKQFGGTIRELEQDGKLRTEYHLVTLIDGNMQGSGSRRAANAALCAQGEGKFAEYHDVLFRHQPGEQDDAFARPARLLELAEKVDGLGGAAFEKCVKSGRHEERVERSNAAFEDSGHQSTPTVLLDGETLYGQEDGEQLTPAKLKKKVEDQA